MATLKGIGFDQSTARTRTGSTVTPDTIQFDVQVQPNSTGTGLSVTNDAFIGGNLVVTGDITSRSTSQLLVGDQFIDLAVGNNLATHIPVGYTGQVAKANGFTEETTSSFTSAGAENGASGSFQITGAFSGTNQNIVLTCLTINNNASLTVTFDTTSTATPTTFTGASATMGTSGKTTEDIVDQLVVLYNSNVKVEGVDSFVVSKTGTDTVTFTSNLGRYSQNNITFVLNNTPPISATNGNSTNDMAKITMSGASSFIQGDILAVSQADTPTNDGLFGVIHKNNADVFICTTASFYPSRLAFLQSDVTTDATDNGAKCVKVDLYVQAVSDGVIPLTGGGTTTLGELVDQFGQNCNFSSFDTYQTVGAGITDLQIAYDNGNAITTSGNDIDFTLSNGDFDITTSAGGNVDIDGSGKFQVVVTDTSTDAILLNANGGTLDLNGSIVTIDSTANTTISAGADLTTNVGGNTGIAKYCLFSITQNSGSNIEAGRVVRLVPQVSASTQVQIVASNIAQDDTLTVQTADGSPVNYVFTARNSGATGQQFDIATGGTASANNNQTAANLVTAIGNASTDLSASRVDDVVTITQVVSGTTGNGKTCQSSDTGTNGMFKPSNSGTQPDNFSGGVNRDIAKATNTSADTSTILGIVATDTATGNACQVFGSDSMIKTTNLSFANSELGQKVYLSTNGQYTTTPPTLAGTFVIEVGIAFDSDTVLFRPSFVMENG